MHKEYLNSTVYEFRWSRMHRGNQLREINFILFNSHTFGTSKSTCSPVWMSWSTECSSSPKAPSQLKFLISQIIFLFSLGSQFFSFPLFSPHFYSDQWKRKKYFNAYKTTQFYFLICIKPKVYLATLFSFEVAMKVHKTHLFSG